MALFFFAVGIVHLTAQPTYSKRYHFDLNSVFFTSIEPVSDSTYLVLGVVTDTIPPYWGATLSTLFDEQGNVLEQHIIRDSQRNVEAWTKDHRAGDRIYKTGYVHGNGIGALLLAFGLEGEPLWEVQLLDFHSYRDGKIINATVIDLAFLRSQGILGRYEYKRQVSKDNCIIYYRHTT